MGFNSGFKGLMCVSGFDTLLRECLRLSNPFIYVVFGVFYLFFPPTLRFTNQNFSADVGPRVADAPQVSK